MPTAYSPPNDWARLIDDLIRRVGSIKALATATGINRNTIRRWRTGESANVSADSIKMLADGVGIEYEEASRAALGAQRQLRAEADEAARIIEESDAPDSVKLDLIAHVRARRRESEEHLRRDIELVLRTRTVTP